MPSAADLELMRDAAEMMLNATAMVSRDTRVSDGMGGGTVTTTTKTVACRVDLLGPNSAQLVEVADRVAGRKARLLSFAYNADVREGDRVTVGALVLLVLAVSEEAWVVVKQAVGVVQA